MTTAEKPTEAPDLTRVRQRHDRTGRYRIYVEDILIGAAEQVRTRGATGRRCTRWRGVPTRAAFTLNRIGAPAPPPEHVAPLPADHVRRDDAVRALVDHLHAVGAPGVADLYGVDHA